MLAWFRAGAAAALFVFVAAPTLAAEKTFQDATLDDAAITLQADLKDDAGTVTKTLPQLKKDADAALKKNDLEAAAAVYTQIVTVAPNDGQAWRRLADIWLRIPATEEDDGSTRFERATTAAYLAYQHAATPNEEADALITLANSYGKRNDWRPALNALKLALNLHATPELKTTYDGLREKYGFRVAEFSVDSDAASPRACFQFSESLPKRTDFSPYVAVAGEDKPALSVDDQQLCVEGLKHGESYAITLRAGLPSTVDETLLKTADFNIYVRDRSPFVRLAGKAYVLPKTGMRGIPLVTVNTDLVKVTIYRIGDRNLIDNVLGYDFERNLAGYTLDQIADEKGEKVWSGELKVEKELNAEITTDFPVSEAVPDLAPGVYLLAAIPGNSVTEDYSDRATQWFVVSDLGLAAYSANDGIHAFVNSLASTAPIGDVELRLIARNNDVLAVEKTGADGAGQFRARARARRGRPVARAARRLRPTGDYAFLDLKQLALRPHRPRRRRARRPARARRLRVHRARRLSHRRDRCMSTSLLRDAAGLAATGMPLTLVVERPDGVEYRRSVIPDQGIGGRSLDVPIVSSAPTGTWRVAVYTDPKRPRSAKRAFWSRTMCRIGWNSI